MTPHPMALPVQSPAATLPLHLSLAGRRVVVVGAGAVAARKVSGCLEAGATVLLVAPQACPELVDRHRAGAVSWRRRCYRAGDLEGAWLVFAATGDPATDGAVERDADAQRSFCVRSDNAAAGSARSPAVLRRGDLVVSVGTSAASSAGPAAADPRRVVAVRNAIGEAIDSGSLPLRRYRSGPPRESLPDR
ncbi:precorrin-2 dehydrogenase/sirohydrochlorin ferrochelatase family protein [Nakamurella sp. GG22]